LKVWFQAEMFKMLFAFQIWLPSNIVFYSIVWLWIEIFLSIQSEQCDMCNKIIILLTLTQRSTCWKLPGFF